MHLIPWTSNTYKPGQCYGRYTIISLHKIAGTYRYFAKCQCACGNEPHYVQPAMLKRGEALSCGCYHKERVTKHGVWGHPLYAVWRSMMSRCYKKNDKRYYCYGKRGITVCDQWHNVHDFIADMSKGYSKGLQIDRIDNNQGYYKDNCRWVDRNTQARNKRNTIYLAFAGKTHCLSEWSHITGIPYKTLWYRVFVRKWSTDKALTEIPSPNGKSNKINHLSIGEPTS
jgi:hypothetical protein